MGTEYSQEIKDVAIERYLSGMTLREVAKTVGCTKSTVFHWVLDSGAKTRNKHGRCVAVNVVVNGNKVKCASMSEAGRLLGLSLSKFTRWLKSGKIETWEEKPEREYRAHPGLDCMPDALLLWKLEKGLVEFDTALQAVRRNIEIAARARRLA